MAAVRDDWRSASLSERELALCTWADKLTREPGAMRESDLEPLRAVGLDDRAIVDLAHVVGYFAYANRIADGLGVDLDPGMPPKPHE